MGISFSEFLNRAGDTGFEKNKQEGYCGKCADGVKALVHKNTLLCEFHHNRVWEDDFESAGDEEDDD